MLPSDMKGLSRLSVSMPEEKNDEATSPSCAENISSTPYRPLSFTRCAPFEFLYTLCTYP